MTHHVRSADGTPIAFDRSGEGPPVVLVGGIFSTRASTQALAEQLAQYHSVVTYDRRGRGESGDTAPYAVEREVEDLGALLDEVGGTAAVYGHSSGAALALNAAADGLPIGRLVLHEPPYGPGDDEDVQGSRRLADDVLGALGEDRRADAVRTFFESYGLPPDTVDEMSRDPQMQALAPTMAHDFAVLGMVDRGGALPEELVRAVHVPTLVLAGGVSPEFFRDTAARIADLLPDGTYRVLPGLDHDARADVVAPVVAEFLAVPR